MMRASVGLAICLAGCAFEHGGDVTGDDGSGSGSGSGSGQVADEDKDGIADADDNCVVVANHDQLNHDMDALGDSCDLCPHVIDTGKDNDFDGVGDACDPRPSEPGDRTVLFEGFYSNVTWKVIAGPAMWQSINGQLRQPGLAPAQLVRDDVNLGKVFVDARMRVDTVATNPVDRPSAGVVLAYRDPNHFLFCGIGAGTFTAEATAGRMSTGLFGNAQYDYVPGAFPAQMAGDWLRIQTQTSPAEWGNIRIECLTHRAGATGTAELVGDADLLGDIGLRTNGTDASFDYVFVVAVGG